MSDDRRAPLERRIVALETALRFYADPENWEDQGEPNGYIQIPAEEDGGEFARIVLTADGRATDGE